MRPGAVVERVVGRHRSVLVDPVDFAARAGQVLRGRRLEVIARGEVELAVVAEGDGTAVMLVVGDPGILIEDELAARDRPGEVGSWL